MIVKINYAIPVVMALVSLSAYPKDKQEPSPRLVTQQSQTSYAIGVEMARNFKRLGLNLDIDTIIKGLRDGTEGKALLLSEEELRKTLESHYASLKDKSAESTKALAEKNQKEGDEYRDKYKAMPGVTTLPSGLQYKIMQAGNGDRPTEGAIVNIHYRGSIANGAEFQNSYLRGQPLTVAISNLIPGLREAIKLMPAGSKWEVVVPPELAYGRTGGGRQIEPNVTLIFEVELFGIQASKETIEKATAKPAEPPAEARTTSP
jgi:FKBP-type peptidyl-prolyl cis-trans isomerase